MLRNWEIVDPILLQPPPVNLYEEGTEGPHEAEGGPRASRGWLRRLGDPSASDLVDCTSRPAPELQGSCQARPGTSRLYQTNSKYPRSRTTVPSLDDVVKRACESSTQIFTVRVSPG